MKLDDSWRSESPVSSKSFAIGCGLFSPHERQTDHHGGLPERATEWIAAGRHPDAPSDTATVKLIDPRGGECRQRGHRCRRLLRQQQLLAKRAVSFAQKRVGMFGRCQCALCRLEGHCQRRDVEPLGFDQRLPGVSWSGRSLTASCATATASWAVSRREADWSASACASIASW